MERAGGYPVSLRIKRGTAEDSGNRRGNNMSKYSALWEYVRQSGKEAFQLTFEEIRQIAGIPIDHSFLKYKKELTEYGWQVGKISMKEQTVFFHKAD